MAVRSMECMAVYERRKYRRGSARNSATSPESFAGLSSMRADKGHLRNE
jgi:hypothetical protein